MSGPPVAPAAATDATAHTRPTVDTLPPEAIALAGKLFDLARAGTTADLEQYIDAGIPANLTNQSGDTLLMLAAYHGHADTVKMLLGKGADPDALNAKGQSPIAGAVFKLHNDVVHTLLDGGADIHAGQPNALDCAKMFKRDDLLKLFEAKDK
ncbi:Putative ankyrin repeat protein [Vanrija pseudolonga]|uniref:Ankyrin repeat protein n=1 Tax=Vanrija pseudolonga TaxID=143232 RepID=A0AAF0YIJ0_9TREE|nr:Putative ankyrin repeat protein [Vanrija pseudolonga]